MVSEDDVEKLAAAARLPASTSVYLEDDVVMNLLETVLDYMPQTEVVVKALERFREKRWKEIRTLDDLERVMERFPDDQAGNTATRPSQSGHTASMLIAQLSDVHVGGGRYRPELLQAAIAEINAAEPELVVVAGDLTDEGYPDQYPLAKQELAALTCPRVVLVPGNHDARNVGYLHFEDTFGTRDSRLRLEIDGLEVALVAVDSSKPDLDEGEVGREHYGWIEQGFAGKADLRIFVCHHHLMPIPGTGRERNQVLDAGDVLSVLRQCEVDLVLSGHRHVPYVWPVAGMLLVHSGTVSTLRTRGFPHPAYNLIRIEAGRVSVELRVPGGERRSLGDYPRDWPEELSARHADPFVRAQRGGSLAEDEATTPRA